MQYPELPPPPPQPRNHHGKTPNGAVIAYNSVSAQTSPSRVADMERQRQAVAARARGLTWDQVAQVAGYSGGASAAEAVKRWFDKARRQNLQGVEEIREMEVARLDRALVEITQIAYDRHLPPDRRLVALEALRRNVETRAKLQGAYAPEKHEIISIGQIERRVAELSYQLGQPLPPELQELPAGDSDTAYSEDA